MRRWRSAVKRGDCESVFKGDPEAGDDPRDAGILAMNVSIECSKLLENA
jgi:hypothetical protein